MTIIEDKRFDEERALYGQRELLLRRCRFDGPADGESALKMSRDITAEDCFWNLRYPLWHGKGITLRRAEMTELCRAALWYTEDIRIEDSHLGGIKALRECADVQLRRTAAESPELGWMCRRVSGEDFSAEGQYLFLRGEELSFTRSKFTGKYGFQYVRDAVFDRCVFDTKDAFWHGKNITVRDSVVKGEYLGWYSEGLTLIRCRIIGTQPLCCCRGLRLIDCAMEGTDLAFENSDVTASVTTPVVSIKNPKSGLIAAPAVGAVVRDDPGSAGQILIGGKLFS